MTYRPLNVFELNLAELTDLQAAMGAPIGHLLRRGEVTVEQLRGAAWWRAKQDDPDLTVDAFLTTVDDVRPFADVLDELRAFVEAAKDAGFDLEVDDAADAAAEDVVA